jgi:hypothetical protein
MANMNQPMDPNPPLAVDGAWFQGFGGGPVHLPQTQPIPQMFSYSMEAGTPFGFGTLDPTMITFDHFQFEDYERNLDFTRFVEQWYYRAGFHEAGYPLLSEEAKMVSSWAAKRPKMLTRDHLNGDRCDFQGINWTKMGVSKETAHRIRQKTYFNYTNILPRQESRYVSHAQMMSGCDCLCLTTRVSI